MAEAILDKGRNGGRQPAPDAEDTPAAPAVEAAPPSGGFKAWLPLLITIACMPALAYATTRFVLVPQMKRALTETTGGAAAPEAAAESKEPGPNGEVATGKIKIPMSKILVNVAGTMGTRYLMTSLTLVGADPNFKGKIDENKDELMDLATSTLSTKTISDLEKPGARNVIRAELITIFNNALGGPLVKEIYITELAIQ